MGLAIEEAEKAYSLAEVPVGAVLVDAAGQVLARAHNLPVSSGDPTAHAEILAIRAASASLGNYRLPGTVLYATLEPCPMCVGAMLECDAAALVYAVPNPIDGAAGSVIQLAQHAALGRRLAVVSGIRRDEAEELVGAFDAAPTGA
jgi:tRNA(Arg) A34 adenosine deaminase TadA